MIYAVFGGVIGFILGALILFLWMRAKSRTDAVRISELEARTATFDQAIADKVRAESALEQLTISSKRELEFAEQTAASKLEAAAQAHEAALDAEKRRAESELEAERGKAAALLDAEKRRIEPLVRWWQRASSDGECRFERLYRPPLVYVQTGEGSWIFPRKGKPRHDD